MVIGPVIPVAGSTAGSAASGGAEDGVNKKIRKPYTITKSRESWTEQEHDKFLEALQLFDRDWKKIEAFVGSKSVIQIRSHAQKYFLKVQKNGSGEHVPPPRPKRKSAQPYPQKATKVGLIGATLAQETPTQPHSSWIHHGPSAGIVTARAIGGTISNERNGNNSDDSSTDVWSFPKTSSGPFNHDTSLKGNMPSAPDFAEIYKFIGSTFDPGVTGHLKKLKEMAPIDRETIMLLMRNLSINLSNPNVEETVMAFCSTCGTETSFIRS
eukprot:TRINITY_DN218_c0_g1_i6.p1 TRINITY_DN218_c0_g1~~TRINITY_DN218_c0_g1_i6.p1  ORF type:complete len:268 (-),score=41.33 TRINITY_DN218_c0_g1_i6:296-1099(-)